MVEDMSLELKKYEGMLWFIMFGYVLIDSLGAYFIWNRIGFPHNSLLVVMMVPALFIWGFKKTLPPRRESIAIVLILAGFLIGVLFNAEVGLGKVFQLATALMAFTVGYMACRWTSDSDKFIKLFFVVGVLYVVTCVIALLKLYPGIFPIINSIGFRANGEMLSRPEVTIDQNFQIFYLFFIPALFILEFKYVLYLCISVLTALSLYVLISLQTRSGVLIQVGVLAIVWIVAPIANKKYGRYKLVLLPMISLVLLVVFFDKIVDLSGPLLERSQSKEVNTFEGRIYSATYLFSDILNPLHWFPQGNEEFTKKVGGIPHFNPTAMYLEGGILALIGWILLFMMPLLRMGRLFIKNKLDLLASLIMVCGLASMMAQLSLNAPLYDHVWLWGGAVIGSLYRIRASKLPLSEKISIADKAPQANKTKKSLTYIHLKKK